MPKYEIKKEIYPFLGGGIIKITSSVKSNNIIEEEINLLRDIKDKRDNKTGYTEKEKYIQIAFNNDLNSAYRIIPNLPHTNKIWIEVGTPLIKREGIRGISAIRAIWGGKIVADLKTIDGAVEEVRLAYSAGASGATVLGSSTIETLDNFIEECDRLGIDSMIDMIGVESPLKVLRKIKRKPKIVILHKGRDEENTRGKRIPYKEINRIKSKYDVLIAAAGGLDIKEAASAIFNGANIVIVNIVSYGSPWRGIVDDNNITKMVYEFLKIIN